MARRSFLRGGLLVGAATVGLAAASSAALTGTAQAATASRQSGWYWCNDCSMIFHSGGGTPAGFCFYTDGPHSVGSATEYFFDYNGSTSYASQSNWSWCSKCDVLFYAPNIGASVCAWAEYNLPSFEWTHTAGSSTNYDVASAAYSTWQGGWNYCTECKSLFHGSGTQSGACPATRAEHWPYNSQYWVGHS